MNTTREHQRSRAIIWRRQGRLWHLCVGSISVARIVDYGDGHLSRISRHDALGWDCVDFASLAQAKACLRRWWATRETALALARHHGLWER
jgi:hypothetical protein